MECDLSKMSSHDLLNYYQDTKRLLYSGYMGKKRKQLIERYNYDPKNGAHLIRLLRMGIEALVTGELNVFREDAVELVAIKRGAWDLRKIQREAEILFADARQALIASPLPDHPDTDAVNDLLTNLLCAAMKNQAGVRGHLFFSKIRETAAAMRR